MRGPSSLQSSDLRTLFSQPYYTPFNGAEFSIDDGTGELFSSDLPAGVQVFPQQEKRARNQVYICEEGRDVDMYQQLMRIAIVANVLGISVPVTSKFSTAKILHRHKPASSLSSINSLLYQLVLLYSPFTLHSQNCSRLPRTVPSGSVNGSFLSRTVPFWKGSAIDSRTVLEVFCLSVNAINSGIVPTHA